MRVIGGDLHSVIVNALCMNSSLYTAWSKKIVPKFLIQSSFFPISSNYQEIKFI